MAPLPVTATERWQLVYNFRGQQHIAQIRTATGQNASDVSAFFDDWLSAFGSAIYTIDIEGLKYIPVNSNISQDSTWTGAASYGSGTGDEGSEPAFLSFVGRSPNGRRVRLTVFAGGGGDTSGDYRYTTGEVAAFDAALAVLETTTLPLVTIGGQTPIWKNYTNTGYNSYFQRKQRAG